MGYKRYSDEYVKTVIGLYNNGKSVAELSKEFGPDPGTIANWIKRFGFKIRMGYRSPVTKGKELFSKDGKQRLCSECGDYKDIETEFRPNDRYVGGVHYRCNACDSKWFKKYHSDNLEALRAKQRQARKNDPERFKGYGLKTHFKMTLEDRDKLFESQGRKCAGCGADNSGVKGRDWHVDHDHACCPGERSCGNCVRGLLCHSCNVILGLAKDDPQRFLDLIGYLESYQARIAA